MRRQSKVDQENGSFLQKLCMICCDEMPAQYFVDVNVAERLECWKQHLVCEYCLVSYVKNKINDANVKDIGCPCASSALDKCQNTFTKDQIIKMLQNDLDQQFINKDNQLSTTGYIYKYKRYLFNQNIDQNPNMRWCPVCSK